MNPCRPFVVFTVDNKLLSAPTQTALKLTPDSFYPACDHTISFGLSFDLLFMDTIVSDRVMNEDIDSPHPPGFGFSEIVP